MASRVALFHHSPPSIEAALLVSLFLLCAWGDFLAYATIYEVVTCPSSDISCLLSVFFVEYLLSQLLNTDPDRLLFEELVVRAAYCFVYIYVYICYGVPLKSLCVIPGIPSMLYHLPCICNVCALRDYTHHTKRSAARPYSREGNVQKPGASMGGNICDVIDGRSKARS